MRWPGANNRFRTTAAAVEAEVAAAAAGESTGGVEGPARCVSGEEDPNPGQWGAVAWGGTVAASTVST